MAAHPAGYQWGAGRVVLAGGGQVVVGEVYAVGRNYRAHAAELGNEVPDEPFFFLKTRSSLWRGERPPRLPFERGPIHHEVEMVVMLGRAPRDASAAACRRAVRAVGVGLDLTLRELQNRLKAKGLPWALAKSFVNASIVSPLAEVAHDEPLDDLPLSLRIGGRMAQEDRTSSMVRPVAELIAYLAARVPLRRGDLIFTGTPAGVGELAPGDRLELRLGELAALDLEIR